VTKPGTKAFEKLVALLNYPPSRLSVPVAMRLEHALAHDDYLFLKYRR
jgi:hypothetical protein